MKSRTLVGPLLTVLALAAPTARATLLPAWSLDQLAQRADLVVVGVVGSQKSVLVHGELMTETWIAVEEVLKGQPVTAFVLSQLGGRDGQTVVEVVGDARLKPGQRVALFTYRHRDGRRYLAGMALGAFWVGHDRATQQIDGPLLDATGTLRPAPGRRHIDLAAIREAIARVRP